MEIAAPEVFQTDSYIVNSIYKEQNNYIVEHNDVNTDSKICCIYFSSNDIYYPNTEEVFRKRIIEKNYFEWYHTRIRKASKHIFVRDIKKQWYLSGINAGTNSPEKLLELLKNLTEGYRIITVGSSAGGYAAVLYGHLLKAYKVLSFNGQFELNSLLKTSQAAINPLLFRLENTAYRKYFDLKEWIVKQDRQSSVYYFYSINSQWDSNQYYHINHIEAINSIGFRTNHHGIPFTKNCLDAVLNVDNELLTQWSRTKHSPLFFAIKLDGLVNTLRSILMQLITKMKNRSGLLKVKIIK